jgi:hypothetical protein
VPKKERSKPVPTKTAKLLVRLGSEVASYAFRK